MTQQGQNTFNHVVDHLKDQNRQAVDNQTRQCSYAAFKHDGAVLKCAVGCLLAGSDLQIQALNTASAEDLRDVHFKPEFVGNDPEFLIELMQAHDGNLYRDEGFDGIKDTLRAIAKAWFLDVPASLQEGGAV